MQVSGELRQWPKITLDLEGPSGNEAASTFRDNRMDVTFTNAKTGTTMTVPGCFRDQLLNSGGLGAERMLHMRARTGGTARRVREDAPAS